MGVIFLSPQSPKVYDVREHILKVDKDTGVTTSIVIRPSKGDKTPTMTSARLYMALLEIWEQQGQSPDGRVFFSARLLNEVMGKKWQGKSSAYLVSEHIAILRRSTIDWFNTYKHPDGKIDTVKTDLNILTESQYAERRYVGKSDRFRRMQVVQIAPSIISNILANHVRPINQQSVRAIKDDTAAILFTILDLHLSSTRGKPQRRRRALNLIQNDLGFTGARYLQKNNRKAQLDRLITNLDRQELINGRLRVWMEDTVDGADYNLCYKKEPRVKPSARTGVHPQLGMEEASNVAEDICEQILRIPNHGIRPKKAYIAHLARYIPPHVMQNALSEIRADFNPSIKNTSASALFVSHVQKMADKQNIPYPKKI